MTDTDLPNLAAMYERIRRTVTDDPIFDNFVRAFCDLTDEQRERFGLEYASILYDLIGDYPFDDELSPGMVVPKGRAGQ